MSGSTAAGAAIEIDIPNCRVRADASVTCDALRDAAKKSDREIPGFEKIAGTVVQAVQQGTIPRRSILALETTINGHSVRSSAPVLKDVVGYDLTGLLLGTGEAYGTITAVWFRLVPSGAEVWTGEPAGSQDAELAAALTEI